jgi:hypothetical protein
VEAYVKMPLISDDPGDKGLVLLTPREYGAEVIGNQIEN